MFRTPFRRCWIRAALPMLLAIAANQPTASAVDLDGYWRDSNGDRIEMLQTGDELKAVALTEPVRQWWTTGEGKAYTSLVEMTHFKRGHQTDHQRGTLSTEEPMTIRWGNGSTWTRENPGQWKESEIDAVLGWYSLRKPLNGDRSDDTAYFVKDGRVIPFGMQRKDIQTSNGIDPIVHRLHPKSDWPRIVSTASEFPAELGAMLPVLPDGWKKVDALLNLDWAGRVLVCRESEALILSRKGNAWEVLSGPTSIEDLTDGFFDSIDAAISWDRDLAYLFSRDEYMEVKFSPDTQSITIMSAEPRPLRTLSNMPFDEVDATVNWLNGEAYFFRGGEYSRCRYEWIEKLGTRRPELVFDQPRPIDVQHWPELIFGEPGPMPGSKRVTVWNNSGHTAMVRMENAEAPGCYRPISTRPGDATVVRVLPGTRISIEYLDSRNKVEGRMQHTVTTAGNQDIVVSRPSASAPPQQNWIDAIARAVGRTYLFKGPHFYEIDESVDAPILHETLGKLAYRREMSLFEGARIVSVKAATESRGRLLLFSGDQFEVADPVGSKIVARGKTSDFFGDYAERRVFGRGIDAALAIPGESRHAFFQGPSVLLAKVVDPGGTATPWVESAELISIHEFHGRYGGDAYSVHDRVEAAARFTRADAAMSRPAQDRLPTEIRLTDGIFYTRSVLGGTRWSRDGRSSGVWPRLSYLPSWSVLFMSDPNRTWNIAGRVSLHTNGGHLSSAARPKLTDFRDSRKRRESAGRFRFVQADRIGREFHITSPDGRSRLDVQASGTAEGTPVALYSHLHDGANQRWVPIYRSQRGRNFWTFRSSLGQDLVLAVNPNGELELQKEDTSKLEQGFQLHGVDLER